jgi:hypothetical protein
MALLEAAPCATMMHNIQSTQDASRAFKWKQNYRLVQSRINMFEHHGELNHQLLLTVFSYSSLLSIEIPRNGQFTDGSAFE